MRMLPLDRAERTALSLGPRDDRGLVAESAMRDHCGRAADSPPGVKIQSTSARRIRTGFLVAVVIVS